MPLDTDAVLGSSYLSAEDFRARWSLFGVGAAGANFPDSKAGNETLLAVLAAASRAVEVECGQEFTGEVEHVETKPFDLTARRVRPDHRVGTLLSFAVRVGPESVAEFQVADVYFNPQLNYLELAALSLTAGGFSEGFYTLGLTAPVAEIRYRTPDEIPTLVKQAVGFQAAWLINTGFAAMLLPHGLTGTSLGGVNMQASNGGQGMSPLAPVVKQLLAPLRRIPIA